MSSHQEEVTGNYEAFTRELPQILEQHRGKAALMHDRQIVEFFDTVRDAYLAGMKLFPDGLFSVQQVADTPVDLGFFSHALSHG